MSTEEEKRKMIFENSEVVLSVRDLTAEVDGTPILRE
jgi:Fe-S cluster assembly ATP-binding protein